MKKWFYMSFVDRSKPKGERWIGALMVLAKDRMDAVDEAHRFGVNGGGEVAIMELADGMIPRPSDTYRFITDPDEAKGLVFDGKE